MSEKEETTFKQLQEFTAELMEEKGVPGVALGVFHDGQTMTAGLGVTNIDHPLPVTAETLFQIGSITKTFTGTTIMRLVEMGKIDLDTPVRTYVPEFRMADETAASQATVRHLLTHMGGWAGDVFNDTGAGDDALARYVAEMADVEQVAPLNSVWSYNNAGFSLAGHVIEKVTGYTYETALKELLLEPLGAEHIYFRAGDIMTYRFAVGHKKEDEETKVARPWPLPRSAYAAGGIVCDVHELLRYARFHLGNGTAEDGTRLLQPEALSQMHTPQVEIGGSHQAIGLSWFINDADDVRQLSHGGGTMGQVSLLLLVPTHHFAIVIFTNAESGGTLTQEISRWALKEYLDLEVTDPDPIEASEEELAAYVGRYSRPFADIELTLQDGALVVQVTPKKSFPDQHTPPGLPPPPVKIALYEKDRFIALEEPYKGTRLEIIRKPDGSIGWLRSGRIHKRVD